MNYFEARRAAMLAKRNAENRENHKGYLDILCSADENRDPRNFHRAMLSVADAIAMRIWLEGGVAAC